jgi:hypothetical protein
MLDFAKTNESWTTIIARPGMVVQRGSLIGEASMMIALALVDAVVHGSEELLLPHALVQRGQNLVEETIK